MVCHDGVPVPFEPFSICYLVADYTVYTYRLQYRLSTRVVRTRLTFPAFPYCSRTYRTVP